MLLYSLVLKNQAHDFFKLSVQNDTSTRMIKKLKSK